MTSDGLGVSGGDFFCDEGGGGCDGVGVRSFETGDISLGLSAMRAHLSLRPSGMP